MTACSLQRSHVDKMILIAIGIYENATMRKYTAPIFIIPASFVYSPIICVGKTPDANKNNADIILWLKQCILLEREYIKGTKVYYYEIKDVGDCYKTIFITQK